MRFTPPTLAAELVELVADGRGNDDLYLSAQGPVGAWLDNMPDFERLDLVVVDIDPQPDAGGFTVVHFDDANPGP